MNVRMTFVRIETLSDLEKAIAKCNTMDCYDGHKACLLEPMNVELVDSVVKVRPWHSPKSTTNPEQDHIGE